MTARPPTAHLAGRSGWPARPRSLSRFRAHPLENDAAEIAAIRAKLAHYQTVLDTH